MGGGQQEPTITPAPTLLPEQIDMLLNLISGVMGNVEGFPLGAPYGGPSASSFTTRPFTWGGGLGGGAAPPESGPGHGGPGPGPEPGPGEPGEPRIMARPRIQPISPSAPVTGVSSPAPVPIPTGPPAPVNVLPEVLNTPTGNIMQDPVQQIITEILTSPFVAPFREERTGNYPRRV